MKKNYFKIIGMLTVLGITFTVSTLNAQSPVWQWAQKAGGTANDGSNGVCVDASGNTYVAGQFSSSSITFGSTTLTNSGGIDFFLVKYDAAGNVLWAKGATGVSNDGAYNVTVDASGNAYVIGTFNSAHLTFGTTTIALNSYDDIFIVKYDATGNVVWAKSAGGADNDIGQTISVDATGNTYITGYFASSSMAFGSTTLTNSGGNDFYVAKYDATGNVVWAKKAGGTSDENGLGIAADASGNTYVTGQFSSSSITFGSTTLTNSGGIDFFLVKYDASGNIVWAKGATGTSNEAGYDVEVDGRGNAYVVGTYNSSHLTFGTTTIALNSYDDVFTVKYDASGNVVWAKTAGGTGNDVGVSIAVDNSGSSYITGYFASAAMAFGSATLANTGANAVFAASYDVSGNPLWAKNAGGTSDDRGTSIATDATGNNRYVAGHFSSTSISFLSTVLSSAGGNDMFVSKLGNLDTGVEEHKDQTSFFTIAPNPNNGSFALKLNEDQSSTVTSHISVTNTLGQLVYEADQTSPTVSLTIAQPGIYFVTVKAGSRLFTKKMMIN